MQLTIKLKLARQTMKHFCVAIIVLILSFSSGKALDMSLESGYVSRGDPEQVNNSYQLISFLNVNKDGRF